MNEGHQVVAMLLLAVMIMGGAMFLALAVPVAGKAILKKKVK